MNPNKQTKGDFQQALKPEYNQHNQSTYCDYSEAFIGYDQIRRPHGLETILDVLWRSKVP